MNNKITRVFDGQEIKVITDEGKTLINLACTARVCGLIKIAKSGNQTVRWTDKGVAEKLKIIHSTNVEHHIKEEIVFVLDEIENADDRNSIYISSWLSKRLTLECHSEKAMRYKNFLVTLDEDFQNGKLFQNDNSTTLELVNQQLGLMNKQVGGVLKEVKRVSSRVDNLEFNIPLFNVECKELQSLVRKTGINSLGGYGTPAYKNNSLRGKVYSDIQRQLKREFGVKRYEAIKRCQFEKAKEIIQAYIAPTVLQEQITLANNQVHI